ncbi:hypothetical protein BX616_000681 [Lobosporangium transversale]|uniref:D-isomer specific 2-hydroxyacid dehydrogenase NAD-binding domain-containing protein n=1 Tax=Lobosporangium transversale TaxID=64571 RepID=A0A1Y2GVK6_9FUNG|nr:hypothetical protein BCR41DRAFT_384442 [Lobosporangium transversale]KAF9906568.1 hypothetical protein BX616_000681 [Lobosporangium transversale]ORZ26336.1 hypothetical protein BCR41DRAFT_384442 [Lobosporangium transversale]|eukprot:XP_021884101.1 hypothetical protein BCR41DRAFT_384442 [Lobosporangium transversale]
MPSRDTPRPTMLILDELPQSCKNILSSGGIQLEFLDAHKASFAEIQLRMSYCNLIAIRSRKTAEIISYLLSYWPTSRLHAIACFEGGVASALTIKHIPILTLDSTPSPYAVSELCLSLTIILSRQLLNRNRQAHGGIWNKDHTNCHEIRNKTMGILGIESNQVCGHQTGILAQALGMHVIAHTPRLHIMTHGRTTNVKDLDTVAQQSDFMVILDDGDLMENPASIQVRRSLQGQILIHASVGDDDGKRTKKFLNWLEKAVAPVTEEQEKKIPIQLGGLAIVIPSSDFDEDYFCNSVDVQTHGGSLEEEARDEGYSTEDYYACFKTGQHGRTSTAVQKRRLAWRDQLRRIGVDNVVFIPQHTLDTVESFTASANKFVHKLVDMSKEIMTLT